MGQELNVLKPIKKHVKVFPCVYVSLMELWREGRSPSCLSSLHHCSTVLSWLAVCSYSCEDTMQLNDSHTLSLWGVCWVKRAPEM